MTTERSHIVVLRGRAADRARGFADAAETAARRAHKALPGDRSDIVRFEELASAVEAAAKAAWVAGADVIDCAPDVHAVYPWGEHLTTSAPQAIARLLRPVLTPGAFCVFIQSAFASGPTSRLSSEEPRMPAEPFRTEARGRAAVADRFDAQCRSVLAQRPGAVINPSGVMNTVLTEGLRCAFAVDPKNRSVDAPVVYRDGSQGPPLRLASIAFTTVPIEQPCTRRFALLSIRHPDLDIEVDGCWLRNTVISRPRPAGETDRLVYELSKGQLADLLEGGPLTIVLYQTGLETAIVGFYRAVADVLRDRPRILTVLPKYWSQETVFDDGVPWSA